jgi:glutathione S-transferase
VICEFLDQAHGGARMVPVGTPAHWLVLRLQAVGDGIMDAAVGIVMEGRRPEGERSAGFVAGQERKIDRAATWLETHARELEGGFNLGGITVACALGYVDFRLAGNPWREGRPTLAAWFDEVNARESMRRTRP